MTIRLTTVAISAALLIGCANAPEQPAAEPAQALDVAMDQHMKKMHEVMAEHGKAMQAQMEKDFRRMDTNRNGNLSLKEVETDARTMFSKMDANHDGRVTLEEMRKHRAAMHKESGKAE